MVVKSQKASKASTKDRECCGQMMISIEKQPGTQERMRMSKGNPISLLASFVGDDPLSNTTPKPGFPRKIAVETTHKWIHELRFSVVTKKKGTFVDRHERDDVVEYCNTFLQRLWVFSTKRMLQLRSSACTTNRVTG